jgi:hypothetical protein
LQRSYNSYIDCKGALVREQAYWGEDVRAGRSAAIGGASQATVYTPLGRDRLARLVVVGSFLTLFLLVGTLIVLSHGAANSEASKTANNAFTAVLPVLAGWVGTVLAFYFSAASQERTSQSLDRVISRNAGGPVQGVLISQKMLPLAHIAGLQQIKDEDGHRPRDFSLLKILEVFDTNKIPSGAPVTRLLFLERGVFKYVIHRSTLDAFIVKTGANTSDKSLADMLADEETLRVISKLVVFVSAGATLADAKAALEKVAGAQDIIITGSGNATEPMLGWMSNVDLTRALQV